MISGLDCHRYYSYWNSEPGQLRSRAQKQRRKQLWRMTGTILGGRWMYSLHEGFLPDTSLDFSPAAPSLLKSATE